MYKMVTLIKQVPDGVLCIDTWIRKEVAIKGAVLDKLKDMTTGQIRNGWTVESVVEGEVTEQFLMGRSNKYDDLSKKCDH
jgi:hypothetical protein